MIGASSTGIVAKAETLATDVWNVTSWPETDFAADVGWNAGWFIMMLGMLKVVSIGLHAEHKARGSFFSRH